jgi:hypothetical protein
MALRPAQNMVRRPAPSRGRHLELSRDRLRANMARRRKARMVLRRNQADRARKGNPMVPHRGRAMALRLKVNMVRPRAPKATRPARSRACRRATPRNGAPIIPTNATSCSASRRNSNRWAAIRHRAGKAHLQAKGLHPTRAAPLLSSSSNSADRTPEELLLRAGVRRGEEKNASP